MGNLDAGGCDGTRELSTDLGLCRPQGRGQMHGGKDRAFCFTSKKHADDFANRFGGQLIDKWLEAPV